MRAFHILRAQRAFFAAARPLKLTVRRQCSGTVRCDALRENQPSRSWEIGNLLRCQSGLGCRCGTLRDGHADGRGHTRSTILSHSWRVGVLLCTGVAPPAEGWRLTSNNRSKGCNA